MKSVIVMVNLVALQNRRRYESFRLFSYESFNSHEKKSRIVFIFCFCFFSRNWADFRMKLDNVFSVPWLVYEQL